MADIARLSIIFNADTTPLERGFAKAKALLADYKKQTATSKDVELDADATPLSQALKVASAELDKFSRKDASATIDADTGRLKTSLRAASAEIDKFAMKSPTVSVNADTGAATTKLKVFSTQARLIPNHIKMSVNTDTGAAMGKLLALRALAVGGGGAGGGGGGSVESGFLKMGAAANSTFAVAIPAAIAVSIAALAPLMGGAAAGGSAIAGVTAGYGLMFLAGKEAFGKLQQVNGKWVVKTREDATKNLNQLAKYMNKISASYEKAIEPASNAFAGFAADVIKQANKIIPYMGRIAQKTVQQVHSAFNNIAKTMAQPREVASFKRITDAIPPMTANFSHALGNFSIGIGNILGQATPLAKSLVHWFDRMSADFLKWTRSKQGREEIASWLHDAAVVGPKVAWVIGAIAKGLIHMSEAKGTQNALRTILDLMEAIGRKKGSFKNVMDDLHQSSMQARKDGPPWTRFGLAIHDAIGRAANSVKRGADSMMNTLTKWAHSLASWTRKIDQQVSNAWQSKIWGPTSRFLSKTAKDWSHSLSKFMGDAVGWARSLDNRVGNVWNKFWNNVATFLVKRKNGMGNTLSNFMGGTVSWVRSFDNKVGNVWNHFWQATADFLSKRKTGMGNTLSNFMGGTVSWVHSFDNKVGNVWNKFWQNTADFLMKRKDGWGGTLSNFMSSAVNWVKSFPNKVGTLWNKFWQGAADFVVKKKDGIIQTMQNLVSGVENWWQKLIGFINKVLNAVGLDPIGANGGSSGSSGSDGGGNSSSGGGGNSKPNSIGPGGNVLGHASGGLHTREGSAGGEALSAFARGGMAHPRQPRVHLWGEGDYEEAFVTADPRYRKQNLYYLKTIASKLGQVVVPGDQRGGDFGGGGRARSVISQGGFNGFKAGGLSDEQLATYKQRGEEYIGDPYKYGNIGTFAGPGGASCSGLWAHIIYGRTGNQSYGTYAFHSGTPGMQRGGGQVEIGVELSGGGGNDGTHMAGDIDGTSYESNIPAGVHHGLKAGNFPTIWHLGSPHAALVGSGGGAMATESLWESAGNAAWNRWVQPRLDALQKNSKGKFALTQAATKVSINTAEAIKNWIIGQSGGIGSGGSFGGGDAMKFMVESLKRDHLPADWAHDQNLWNIANSESGTTSSNVVWQPNGPKYMAPWGMIVPNRYGVSPGSPQIDRFAVGPRYVKDQYGTPEKAWAFHKANNWYGRGGILSGSGGVARHHAAEAVKRALVIGDSGGVGTGRALVGITNEAGPEAIIPKRRTAEGMQALRTAQSWYQGSGAGGARGLSKEAHDILRNIEHHLEHLVKHGFDLKDKQALLEMADHWQGSPGGSRQWAKQFQHTLQKERKKARAK